ncbi:MAG: flagellin [Bdellovibrionota bacterium]|nr:flagellin [Bdellovibrionota bacterium]
MGLRISTNIASIAAQRSLDRNTVAQTNAYGKLSSGSRINRASDDAAGLAMSEKLKARITGSKQAERNANDGISMLQTAEGGLNEVSRVLVRLRELAVQSSSDTVGDSEREFANLEYQNLKKEIERISQVTEYNGAKLLNGEGLDGQGAAYDIQVGVNNRQFEDRMLYKSSFIDSTLASLFGGEDMVQAQKDLRGQLNAIDNDTYTHDRERVEARRAVQDAYVDGLENGINPVSELSVINKEYAQLSLRSIDSAIQKVSNQRAELGSVQNRLNSVIANLQVTNENLSATNSRIRDTDYASEAARSMKLNILNQASTAVLAQANASGQGALRLLG